MAVLPQDPRQYDPRRPLSEPDDPYAATCPLGDSWQHWDLASCWRDELPPDAEAIADRAERVRGVRLLSTLNPRWVWALDDPSRLIREGGSDPSGDHLYSSHVHTELTVDGRRVHVDWCTATKTGPGRSFIEVRIFIDAKFAGRAGYTGSSIGDGGSSSFPAVALVGNGKALVVDGQTEPVVAYQDAVARYNRDDASVQRPLVRLWEVEERIPERRSKRAKYQRPPFATKRDRRKELERFERLTRDEGLDAEMPDAEPFTTSPSAHQGALK